MRMDRYEEDFKLGDSKQTRTNKNQELYTDVYLNNVYVDINNLKDVMQDKELEEKDENIRIKKDSVVTNYTYQDKNYDINSLIEEAIKNKKDDNVKRNLDFKTREEEIVNLIESINENQKDDNKSDDENLLSDLMPNNDDTTVIPPLQEPILDTALIENSKEESKDENVSLEMLGEDISDEDLETDDSFVDKDNSKLKIIIPILIILIIGITVGVLFYFDII